FVRDHEERASVRRKNDTARHRVDPLDVASGFRNAAELTASICPVQCRAADGHARDHPVAVGVRLLDELTYRAEPIPPRRVWRDAASVAGRSGRRVLLSELGVGTTLYRRSTVRSRRAGVGIVARLGCGGGGG